MPSKDQLLIKQETRCLVEKHLVNNPPATKKKCMYLYVLKVS